MDASEGSGTCHGVRRALPGILSPAVSVAHSDAHANTAAGLNTGAPVPALLRLMVDLGRRNGTDVTVLSSEIHLVTRAVMEIGDVLRLNQLVASGIAHRPPPKGWARFLEVLSRFVVDPLPDHPIRVETLPGLRRRYVAERNYLILERSAAIWTAKWDLEESCMTDALT